MLAAVNDNNVSHDSNASIQQEINGEEAAASIPDLIGKRTQYWLSNPILGFGSHITSDIFELDWGQIRVLPFSCGFVMSQTSERDVILMPQLFVSSRGIGSLMISIIKEVKVELVEAFSFLKRNIIKLLRFLQ